MQYDLTLAWFGTANVTILSPQAAQSVVWKRYKCVLIQHRARQLSTCYLYKSTVYTLKGPKLEIIEQELGQKLKQFMVGALHSNF
jgi:hypothetical protein